MTSQETPTALPNFWKPNKPENFTDLERAVMEGGHSLEEDIKSSFSFIKYIIDKKHP